MICVGVRALMDLKAIWARRDHQEQLVHRETWGHKGLMDRKAQRETPARKDRPAKPAPQEQRERKALRGPMARCEYTATARLELEP